MMTFTPRLLPGFVVLMLACTAVPAPAQSTADASDLFESSVGAPSTVVQLRRETLENSRVGSTLRLNLRSASVAASARVTNVAATPLGSRVIRGQVEGQPGGSLLLVRHGAATAGIVSISPTERYLLNNQGIHVATTPSAALCACAGDASAPRKTLHLSAAPARTAATTLAQFDVLIVYTAAALNAEGSLDALTAQADLAMADANTCYQNSGIPIQGRIVGLRAVDYAESGEIRIDLHHLAFPDDGVLDEVQGYRDEAQADMVCLFTRKDSADGYKGYAEILTAVTPDAEVLGFSVVDVQAATVDHLFAHELGHNMGCDHDRENTTGLHLFDFSYGWRFTGTDGVLYRDVMAYPPGTSVGYFGTPGVSYAGTPTGVADYADTARTLIASAPAFVNFRAADGRGQVSVSASVPEASVDDTGDRRATFAFERTGSVAQPLDVAYQTGGRAVAGVNYGALPGTVNFAAGSHFASVSVDAAANAPPFGLGTVTVTLQPGDAYVVADSPDGSTTAAAVTLYDRQPLVSLGNVRRVGGAPGKLKIRVSRLGHIDAALVVHFRVRGTAVAGVDYRKPGHGSVTIPAGQDAVDVHIHLLDSAMQPGNAGRTVKFVLKGNDAYNVGAAGTAGYSL